jgi:hypothetical protein
MNDTVAILYEKKEITSNQALSRVTETMDYKNQGTWTAI